MPPPARAAAASRHSGMSCRRRHRRVQYGLAGLGCGSFVLGGVALEETRQFHSQMRRVV